VDVNGDGVADLTYRFAFQSRFVDPGTYVYQTGVIGPPPNPADPSSQYVNLNRPQGYTLTELGPARGNGQGEGSRQETVLLRNARTGPNRPGPKTFVPNPGGPTPIVGPDTANYAAIADLAVHTVPNAGGMRVFAGARDESFYVDIGTAFDRINPRAPGFDGTAGFNVHSIAIEVPKARFLAAGDTDTRIGVWATAARQKTRVLGSAGNNGNGNRNDDDDEEDGDGRANNNGPFVQVSRLANPLFSEFLNRLDEKDIYNASAPPSDRARRESIVNPGARKGPNSLEAMLRMITQCTAVANRLDQEASWLLGYPAGVVNGFPGNRETQTPRPAIAEVMRLNYSPNIPIIPASPTATRGVLDNDFAGFPNGRRVTDDTVDILLRLWGGELQGRFGDGNPPCPVASQLTDNVPQNDVPYLTRFPYLGLPQDGYGHDHPHGIDQP